MISESANSDISTGSMLDFLSLLSHDRHCLIELMTNFPCDHARREPLDLRWPNGAACPRCGNMELCKVPDRHKWQCLRCDYRLSMKAGTIMHDSVNTDTLTYRNLIDRNLSQN